ncbi:MAG TPA: host attachment protein [Sulfuricaulis sp.]|nr:host attachment protein [Sulfuricaulis sp.]
MNNIWILVAHRGGARVFENKGPGKGLNLLHDIPHPEGRLKNKDIGSDKPGRSFDSRGQGRHSLSSEQEPTAHLAEQFAKQLSSLLEDGRNQQRYRKLVLVAEPRFLGNLRAVLSAPTAALVSGVVGKDLGGVNPHDMPKHLGNFLRL